MILPALFTSFCISLILFFIYLMVFTAKWALFAMIVTFLVSFIVILLSGIPLLVILKKYKKLNWFYILFGGFIIGFMFSFLLSILSLPSGNNYGSIENGEIIIKNGVITSIGWLRYLQSSIIPSLIGIIASAIFYKTLQFKERKKP